MQNLLTRTATFALLLLITTVLSACDLIGETAENTVKTPTGVYVANQGNFGDANGSISFYDPSTGSVEHDVISNIGSIIQSIALRGDKGYIMANSAERIDVFSLEQHSRLAQIQDIKSPRYMAFVNDTTAYVTNQSTGTVTIINTETDSKRNILKVGSNPEGIAVSAGKAYVANHDFGSGSTVSVINTEAHLVENTIDVNCDGPRGVISDRQHDVWVFCTGNTIYDEDWNVTDRTNGAVRVLDPATGEIDSEFAIEGQIATAGPGQDVFFSPSTQAVYVVVDKERILRYDTANNAGPTEIPVADGDPIGAVAYSAGDELLYVGRTPGFDESGTVELYTPGEASVVDEFTAGVAPAYIAFDAAEE